MFGFESPLTYPDRLDRLNLLPLSYRRDIAVSVIQIYLMILVHYLQTVYILEMTRDILDNLYIVGTSFPKVLEMQAH